MDTYRAPYTTEERPMETIIMAIFILVGAVSGGVLTAAVLDLIFGNDTDRML